jgi:hypothetical protein
LADFCSRTLADGFRKNLLHTSTMAEDGFGWLALEPLDFVVCAGGGRRNKKQSNFTSALTPYILERTDVWSTEKNEIHVMMRAKVVTPRESSSSDNNHNNNHHNDNMDGKQLEQVIDALLTRCLGLGTPTFVTEAMNHVACAVVQEKLRQCVAKLDAVAFIADGSILPRKSGANNAPMASPPAVPCQAPTDSTMKQTLQIDLGLLRPFLITSGVDKNKNEKTTTLSITGMIIPKGITLIAGGGYHGKVCYVVALFVTIVYCGSYGNNQRVLIL